MAFNMNQWNDYDPYRDELRKRQEYEYMKQMAMQNAYAPNLPPVVQEAQKPKKPSYLNPKLLIKGV